MNVIKYVALDISEGLTFEQAKTYAESNSTSMQLLEYPKTPGSGVSLFTLYSWLDRQQYLLWKSKGEFFCPITGIKGDVVRHTLEENIGKLNTIGDLMSNVELFHKVFGHPIRQHISCLSEDEAAFRYVLLKEELKELLEAKDTVEQFDAMLDILYILLGTMVQAGYSGEMVERGFLEVQRSNMSKLGADGKPIYREDGKILKGENYSKPKLSELVEEYLNKQKQH